MTLRSLQEKKEDAQNVTENRYFLILKCVNLHCLWEWKEVKVHMQINRNEKKYICSPRYSNKETSK